MIGYEAAEYEVQDSSYHFINYVKKRLLVAGTLDLILVWNVEK